MNMSDSNRLPAGQNRWVILSILFTTHVLAAVGLFSVSLLLPLIKSEAGLNHTEVGILSASFFFGVGLTSAIAGWTVDLIGVRKMIISGTLLLSGSLMAAAWISVFEGMMVLFVIAGIGYSVVSPSSNKAVMYWFDANIRATAMGFKQTGINGGGFLAGMILPPVALALSWRWALSTAGMMVMGATLIVFILFREKPSGDPFLGITPWVKKLKRVVSDRNILLLSAEGFFRVGVQMAFLTYIILFLQRVLKLDLVVSSFLFAVAQGFGAAGRVLWGLLSDRIFNGRRKWIYSLIGMIAMAGFFILGRLGPLTPIWVVFVIAGCLGFTAVGYQGVGLTLLGECAGTDLTGTATGLGQSFFFFGAVMASPGFGYIVDRSGNFSYAWDSLVLLSLLCCVILCFVKEKPKYIERG